MGIIRKPYVESSENLSKKLFCGAHFFCVCVCVCVQMERDGPRPRLCHMKKGSGGYGFNLHSEKNKPGQFIRAVDEGSPAQRAGLRPQDKIIQVLLTLIFPHAPCLGVLPCLCFMCVSCNPITSVEKWEIPFQQMQSV